MEPRIEDGKEVEDVGKSFGVTRTLAASATEVAGQRQRIEDVEGGKDARDLTPPDSLVHVRHRRDGW